MANPSPVPPPNEVNPLERDEEILEQEPKPAQAAQKVTLDLDDAPFLDDIEEEASSEKEEDKPVEPEADKIEEASKTGKPSRLMLIIAGVVVALLLAGLAFWLTRPPPPPEPELPEPEPLQQLQPEPEPQENTLNIDPFWVSYTQGEDVAFLTLSLIVVMDEPTMYMEVQRKEIILRDAVYYFLNNRPLPDIRREDAAEKLKADLMSVMNQHLSRPLTDILIVEYMVR